MESSAEFYFQKFSSLGAGYEDATLTDIAFEIRELIGCI